jgi:glycine/D-amino acid oxidase-like deaminating enzyme
MLSYWERESMLRYDFVVIGGGIIGLSTALTLKERSPNASVLVLERGIFPSGASTKNAGFACFGSLTEIVADMRLNGEETTFKLIEQRIRGLTLLRKRLGDEAIGYEHHGGYELIMEKHVPALAEMEHINLLLREVFKSDVFRVENEKIAEFGFSSHVRALVHNPFEGQLHTGAMMHTLLQHALAKGIVVLNGAEARHLEEQSGHVEISVEHNRLHSTKQLTFEAKKVALCTNAFTSRFVHDVDIKPGRGQVFITRPVENLHFKGAFHVDEGYYYFRNISTPEGDKILLGGGRNLALEAEATTDFGLSYSIQQYLEDLLRTVIVPDGQAKIEKRWTGIMGFSSNKLPIMRKSSDRVFISFGCNGMGVALGSVVGERTAQMLLED